MKNKGYSNVGSSSIKNFKMKLMMSMFVKLGKIRDKKNNYLSKEYFIQNGDGKF